MLSDEYRMTTVGSLPTVVARFGGREPLRDDVGGMFAHRRRSTHERDRTIAIARPQMKLRAKLLASDDVEPLVDQLHARG